MTNDTPAEKPLGDPFEEHEKEWAARKVVDDAFHAFHERPTLETADALVGSAIAWKQAVAPPAHGPHQFHDERHPGGTTAELVFWARRDAEGPHV